MIHAFQEYYLNDFQNFLSSLFDYVIGDLNIPFDYLLKYLKDNNIDKEITNGNPSIISGKSGFELGNEIYQSYHKTIIRPKVEYKIKRSNHYWLGYSLAYYIWYSGKNFDDIFNKVKYDDLLSMYDIYHEMDIMRFVEEMDNRLSKTEETKLKQKRQALNLSQSKLASLSGVSLRMIQLYEQKENDIDKAQVNTLYKLSKALFCDINDLLENPEQ